jgi:hypothetical protein
LGGRTGSADDPVLDSTPPGGVINEALDQDR